MTKIGLEVGQEFNGFVVFVHLNESGVRGIFGKNIEDIEVGDPTSTIKVTALNSETGDITLYNTNYGLPGWDADYNLGSFCSKVVYTDWDYWREHHTPLLEDPALNIYLLETNNYYGYISEGYGSQTDVTGVSTPTGHRQDCIYNKETGFMEFIGLFQEVYYEDRVEVVYAVEQFLLSTDTSEFNASLYYELLADTNTLISPTHGGVPTDRITSDKPNDTSFGSDSSVGLGLTLGYPIEMLFSIFIIYAIKRTHKWFKPNNSR